MNRPDPDLILDALQRLRQIDRQAHDRKLQPASHQPGGRSDKTRHIEAGTLAAVARVLARLPAEVGDTSELGWASTDALTAYQKLLHDALEGLEAELTRRHGKSELEALEDWLRRTL